MDDWPIIEYLFHYTGNDFIRFTTSFMLVLAFIVKALWAISGFRDAQERYNKKFGYHWEFMLSTKLFVGSFVYLIISYGGFRYDTPIKYWTILLIWTLSILSLICAHMWVARRFVDPAAFDPGLRRRSTDV